MRFSIIIPTYNRPQRLSDSLAAIAHLDYPRDEFEVIVVDDGSPEPVEPVARPYAERLNLTVLRQDNAGPGAARNHGAKHSRGEMLTFLDDDCQPRPDWLQNLDSAARRAPQAMLAGSTMNGCTDNVFSATNQVLSDAVCGWLQQRDSPLRFFPTNNLAMPSEGFREIGGFDAAMPLAGGEDREICARWIGSGRDIAEVPGARIDHYHPQTLRSFLGMHFRYGQGAALLHERRQSSPMEFVAKGFYWHLLRASTQVPAPGFRAAALMLLTQAAAAAGYFSKALRPLGALALVWISLLVVALGSQWYSGVSRADMSGTDEAAHFMNGLMVRDYVVQGLPQAPMEYARNYYLHYPKIALGHWPPLFAMILGLWMLPGNVSAASALALVAVIMAFLATIVYQQVRLAGARWPIAWLAAVLLVTLPLGRNALSEVMIEPLCALLMAWATVLYARYLDSGSWRDSAWFALAVVLALYAKPNSAGLALLPPLCVILGNRWRLLKTGAFWLPLAIVPLLAGPWYYWTRHLLEGEMVPGSKSESLLQRDSVVFEHTVAYALHPLPIAIILGGIAGWFLLRKQLASRAVTFASLAIAVLLIHTVVSPHQEQRHYLSALAPILIGLGWLLARMPAIPAGVGAIAILLLQGNPLITPKPITGMTPAAHYVLDHRAQLGGISLVSSEAGGEGSFITAVALNESRPSSYPLRATKMLATQTWMGLNYQLLFTSSESLAEALDRWAVGAVIVDRNPSTETPDRVMLTEALRHHPESWEIAEQDSKVTLWTRHQGWQQPDLSVFRRELAARLASAWR